MSEHRAQRPFVARTVRLLAVPVIIFWGLLAMTTNTFVPQIERVAEELAGPGAQGGFLVATDKNPYQGWRLILPETNPRDPHRPYSNGLVVQVDTPSLESAGK